MGISDKKILAIIPARGGSKGLPRKNVLMLAGRPLIAWTINAAKKSKYIKRVFVSSDDEEIREIANEYGAETVRRPKVMAGDKSPFNLLIFHLLEHLKKKENYIPDILVYLQPTSPLRDSKDLDQAFALMKPGVTGVISVYEVENKFLKSFVLDEKGWMNGLVNDRFPFMSRQDLPKTYMPNGAIYIVRSDLFIRTGSLFSKKTVPFLMSTEKSVDVDTIDDFKEAEQFLKKK